MERPARNAAIALLATGAVVVGLSLAAARPITTNEGVLPPGTELNEERLDLPTEQFSSEQAGGKRSYLFNLGDMLFSSPAIFGGVARQAGMSCNTCHQQGAGNSKLFIPGLSGHVGTFDGTNALFSPKADNGVLDANTPPSLRGAKYLAPYGHDGRFGTLPEFVHNAIVNEFGGPEPSPTVVDALVAYVREIAFLPNKQLAPGGRLSAEASDAARRGEALFNRPFRTDASMTCASCHQPTGAFVDHRQHDVGTGGLFKTPTLVNANFNAPYFHDGRFENYGQVVAYFDRHFELGLSNDERTDLVAYLDAIGDADTPHTRNTLQADLDEIASFVSVLHTAIPARDHEVINLTVESVGNEWREMGENFPGRTDSSVAGGVDERMKARGAVREIVLALRGVAMAAAADDFDGAQQAYREYAQQVAAAAADLKLAEPWSLFNPEVRAAHFQALRQLADLASGATLTNP